MIGRVVGNYRIESVLGVGAYGSVYLALHRAVDRTAAIKALHPKYARNEDVRNRLLAEQAFLDAIRHSAIVSLYDVHVEGGEVFLVMEFVDGPTLWDASREQGLEWERVAILGQQLLGGLALAHARGIVHRDVKPQNVLLGEQSAKLLDFGIAQVLRDLGSASTGGIPGTPAFMAPELWQGTPATPASDVYALGLTLWYALGRAPPGIPSSTEEWRAWHVETGPPDIRSVRPDVPDWLAEVLVRATRRLPGERYPEAKEMLRPFRDRLSLSAEISVRSLGRPPVKPAAEIPPAAPPPAPSPTRPPFAASLPPAPVTLTLAVLTCAGMIGAAVAWRFGYLPGS